MSKVLELFGVSITKKEKVDWNLVIKQQNCPYLGRKCIKVRKSQPEISIGTCSVIYGQSRAPILICPYRLLENRKIFVDCMHLLTLHEPGNELHIVPEVTVPGGSIDYFLVSAKDHKVKDFVGIELQTLDTTGTVWPERQRFLKEVDVPVDPADADSPKGFGMNWKMTAKTSLIQLHHKIDTFQHLNRHLGLIIQDSLLAYLKREFRFDHLNQARLGDPMHVHAYSFIRNQDGDYKVQLMERLSTDSEGIATCLGLQADTNIELQNIIEQLESKISSETLFSLL